MNCAFEDCLVLDECVKAARESSPDNWIEETFRTYNEARIDNANAIANMALENYIEMRDKTADPAFIFRKEVAHLLGNTFPERFLARYERVSFSTIAYAKAYDIGKLNDIVLDAVIAKLDGDFDLSKIDLEHARELCEKYLPLDESQKQEN